MAQRDFAVALYAVNNKIETAFFEVHIYSHRSEADAIRIGLANLKRWFPEVDGWSSWRAAAVRIGASIFDQAAREAEWFDQTGAHRLYTFAVLAINKDKRGGILVGYFLSFGEACAREEVDTRKGKHFPESDGWEIVTTTLHEYEFFRRGLPAVFPQRKNETTH